VAERAQLQYQPVTGPVWREPVAEKLAWLPVGRHQPLRGLPPNRLDWSVWPLPVVAPAFDPQTLEWQPRDSYVGRALSRVRLDWTVEPFSFAAPGFDPQTLDWLPRGGPQARLERRLLGAFVQPPFEALYRPEQLEWLLQGRAPPRSLAAIRTGIFVIDPTPIAAVAGRLRVIGSIIVRRLQ
jgi:hypothetical protein